MSEVLLAHGAARATIALAGAEARRWTVGGRELLWPGDPAIWAEISPILYPVVGWTRNGARVAGRQYELGLHGFARFETFAVETCGPDFVLLRLRDSERTRAVYPFAFALGSNTASPTTRSGSRSRSPIRARIARLTPAGCIRASAGRLADRDATARWCGSRSRRTPKSRRSRRAA